MRIALVYNPTMAPGRLAKVAALARTLESRGHSLTHHDSQTFRAGDTASDVVCVCGGDGTAQLVVDNQPDPAALPLLAVYPTGTINLLARELDYPAEPAAFALRIESGREPVRSPLATVNGRTFLCCVSAGADAHAVAAVSEPLKARIGRLAYLVAMAQVLARWPRRTMQVVCHGRTIEAEAVFVLRGRFYAGPWTLDPAAHLASSALRVLALPRARRRDMARLALHALLGRGSPPADWHVLDAAQVSVRSAEPVPVQIDGDMAGTTPLELTMTGMAVRFA